MQSERERRFVGPRRGQLLFVLTFLTLSVLLLSQIGTQTAWVKKTDFFAQPRFWPAVGVGGMVLFTAGSRHVPAAELALLLLTEVVLAPIWVWLWIGEVPRLWTLVGGAVIFTAIIGHAISGMRRKPPPFGAV